MPTMVTLVDGTVPVAADFNNNYTALNQVCGTSTSITSYTTGDTLYASAANTLSKLTAGSAGQVLSQGATIPQWGLTSLSGTPIANGMYQENTIKGSAQVERGSGAPVIDISFNVASVADGGAGQTTVTWDRDFATGTYAAVASSSTADTVADGLASVDAKLVGSCVVECWTANTGVANDTLDFSIIATGTH